MAGDFDSVGMRGFDGGSQLVRRDVHVRLEGSSTARDPKFDHLTRVFGIFELMHLQSKGPFSFEIRTGHVNFRTGKFSRINGLLEFEVRVRFEAACCSNRSDPAGKIEPRKARGMFRIERKPAAG